MQSPVLTQQANLTPDDIKSQLRRQLASDFADGILTPCAEDVLDRVVAECVEDLWSTSRIKIFVPVLALRHARDEIHAAQAMSA